METKNKASWGGKRENAGRKKSENSKKTVVVRVDEKLLPVIKSIKDKYQAGQQLESLLYVTSNQDDSKKEIAEIKEKNRGLEKQIEQFTSRNLELVLLRDKEHLQSVKLRSKVEVLNSTVRGYSEELELLKHKIYDCQVLKKDGSRCTRQAKLKINWHGIEINSCIQHSKSR